ncbi:MAG: hypothetical protein ABIT04_09780 [Novosphingobium sp.]
MAVVIQEFEAVQEESQPASADAGRSRQAAGPVAHVALDRLLAARRQRLARLWAH